ncbi:hypothetical protein GCM10009000_121070 [Halobacterium noricense]
MSNTTSGVETLSVTETEISYIDAHRVVNREERVPGQHPDPSLRSDGQTEYTERYIECLDCGAERLSKDDFPVECNGGQR